MYEHLQGRVRVMVMHREVRGEYLRWNQGTSSSYAWPQELVGCQPVDVANACASYKRINNPTTVDQKSDGIVWDKETSGSYRCSYDSEWFLHSVRYDFHNKNGTHVSISIGITQLYFSAAHLSLYLLIYSSIHSWFHLYSCYLLIYLFVCLFTDLYAEIKIHLPNFTFFVCLLSVCVSLYITFF